MLALSDIFASIFSPSPTTDPELLWLHGDSIRNLELIRENCTGLAILGTPLYDWKFTIIGSSRRMIASAALELVDAQFSSTAGNILQQTIAPIL